MKFVLSNVLLILLIAFSYVSINQAQKVEYDEALEFLKSLEKEYETNSELQALIQDNIEQIEFMSPKECPPCVLLNKRFLIIDWISTMKVGNPFSKGYCVAPKKIRVGPPALRKACCCA